MRRNITDAALFVMGLAIAPFLLPLAFPLIAAWFATRKQAGIRA